MNEEPVTRITLADHLLENSVNVGHVEVRRISIAPGVMPGAHWHNGPVFGLIESGSVFFQVGDEPEQVLRAGAVFFEPGGETITRFDATEEGVTFVGWFPLPGDVGPELIMGPVPVAP